MDKRTRDIYADLEEGRPSLDDHPHYRLREKKLFYVDRLVVPDKRIRAVVMEYHTLYHAGVAKTKALVEKHCVSSPAMNVACEQVTQECAVFQACKPRNVAPPGSHEPLPPPNDVYTHVSVDFCSMPPVADAGGMFDAFVAVVCRMTSHTIVWPFEKKGWTPQKFAYQFMARVVCLVGMPIHIVSDNDILFGSDWWKALVNALQVQHVKCDA